MTQIRFYLVHACVTALLSASLVTTSQAADPPEEDTRDISIRSDLVRTGLYLISGGGSNTLMRLSGSGSVLVDSKTAGSFRPLMAQTRRISALSDLPVRVLFVTDHHAHHTGNFGQFLTAGIAVIAQENAKPRLSSIPETGARTLAPVVTFDREYSLKIGGVEVRSLHFGKGHTDNDAVVYFPDLKVVAIGDLFTPEVPVPDFAGGGSLAGWGPALEQVLKLDFDIAVPSVGPPMSRANLLAFKTRIDILTARATALIRRGVAKDQLLSQLSVDDLGWRLDWGVEQLDGLYSDLSMP